MKILIVKTSSLGDIIQSYPVLTYIKQKHPEAQIDWVVERPFADLLKAHPLVNKVWMIDSKRWRKSWYNLTTLSQFFALKKEINAQNYDLIFDLQGNLKSGLLLSQFKANLKIGFGPKTVHERVNTWFTDMQYESPAGVNIRDDYLRLPQAHFNDDQPFVDPGVILKIAPEQENQIRDLLNNESKPYLVCPGSAWSNKQVTVEALTEFLQILQKERGCSYLLAWGTDSERDLVEKLRDQLLNAKVIPRLPLAVLQNLMSRVEMVIAMDSLPLHLAGTTGTPTFSVFGASLAEKFKPKGKLHVAMQGKCPYGRQFPKRCPILRSCSTGACIRGLSGPEIYRVLDSVTPD